MKSARNHKTKTRKFALDHKPRVAVITLGCAKNEADSVAMHKLLISAGYEIEDDPDRADAIVINTCSFIQAATEESLEAIFDVSSLQSVNENNTPLIVAGCMPARYGTDLEDELFEVSAFVPCAEEQNIAEVIDRCLERNSYDAESAHDAEAETDAEGDGKTDRVNESEKTPDAEVETDAERDGNTEPGNDDNNENDDASSETSNVKTAFDVEPVRKMNTYGYVKISEGCDRWCSYCTIPFIRKGYQSFSYDKILNDVKEYVDAGAGEIILVAQDTGRWGSDLSDPKTLSWLMDTLADEFPHTWFRVMYLQPEGITDELLTTMLAHDNICHYLDIPIQHVSEELLRAMNRQGNRQTYEQLIEHIHELVPDITLRTTLMVGFPGETDDQFDELCDFVSQGYFDYVGIFAYSREEGTQAYDLSDQIDDDEKTYRAERLRDIADTVSAVKIADRIGSMQNVLIEGREEDGQLFGRAMCQAPDVDGVTYVNNGTTGDIITVCISDTQLYEMEGE